MNQRNSARIEYEGQMSLELMQLESWQWMREQIVAKSKGLRSEVMAGNLTYDEYLGKTAAWQQLKAIAALPELKAKAYKKLRLENN